jgi:hypothetical protein
MTLKTRSAAFGSAIAAPSRPASKPARTSLTRARAYLGVLAEYHMSWFIGRTEAMSNPEAARAKALERLRGLAQLDDPESLVVPILLDAILIAEAYRGARHQVTFLPELTKNVDALLREFNILDKTKEWVEP